MTDTHTYDVSGAMLTVTLFLRQNTIDTVDTSALDKGEPDHSAHVLIGYLSNRLPDQWKSPQSFGWCKRVRTLTCRTGSQARRITQHTIAMLSDAVSGAAQDRDRRKVEMSVAVVAYAKDRIPEFWSF